MQARATRARKPPKLSLPLTPRALLARWRAGTFGRASEEPYRRRPSDGIRLGTAIVVLFVLARHVNDVSPTEQAFFNFFNSLPSGLESLFVTLYRLGALWAVALVATAALLVRRWRLARDLALSGGIAWGAARALGVFVVDSRGVSKSLDVVTRLGDTPSFPLVRLAIVVAVVGAASPYMSRPARRVGAVLVVLLALASMYLGTALPNDALAGIVLGWGVAAAVHFVFGSPGGRPTAAQVHGALAQLGIAARGVHLAPHSVAGATLMHARDDDGGLAIKVIGRDEADAQLIAKVWRFVAYKDSGPTLFFTRIQQVEHEAYELLLAQNGGVRVPDVVIAGTAGPGAALLVGRRLEGKALCDLAPKDVTPALLKGVWTQVARLHDARVAHGALNTANIIVTKDGPGIVEFGSATAWTPERGADDVAELLACTAHLVGEKRAVAAAVLGIGSDAVADSLAFLQPAALRHQTRSLAASSRKDLRDRLEKLRELGAEETGTQPPALQELHRVRPANVLMAVGTLIAAAALLGQVGSPSHVWETLKHAEWGWVLLAFALSMATNIGTAFALMGTVPIRLPLGPTTELQVAMGFSNLAIPAIGGTAMQIRFLQKRGIDLGSAIAAGGLLSTVANIATQIGLFAVALWLAPNDVHLGNIPTSGLPEVLLIAALVLGVLAAAIFGIPRLRRTVVPPILHAVVTLWESIRSPRRVALLIGGNVVTALVYGACLLTCLLAFGEDGVSFWTLLALNIGIGTIASLVPVPGGGTAVSSVGLTGALVALGVHQDAAVAAVLTNQIVTNYLPAIPGWVATRNLMKREYL